MTQFTFLKTKFILMWWNPIPHTWKLSSWKNLPPRVFPQIPIILTPWRPRRNPTVYKRCNPRVRSLYPLTLSILIYHQSSTRLSSVLVLLPSVLCSYPSLVVFIFCVHSRDSALHTIIIQSYRRLITSSVRAWLLPEYKSTTPSSTGGSTENWRTDYEDNK